MPGERVPVGRMPGRGRQEWTWRLTVIGTGVAMLGMIAWEWVTHPSNRPYAIALLVGFPATFLALLHLDTWLDTELGGLRHRRA